MYETTKLAAIRARNGDGPTLIETKINRFLPHTSDDDHSRYRDIDELSNQKDPIEIYKQFLIDNKFLTNAMAESLVLQINDAVDSATEYVESLPYPNKDTFYSHIYKTNE